MEPDYEIVATGIWYYDKTVPKRIVVQKKEARFHSSRYRYDDDHQLDEGRPIPDALDGFFYICWPGNCSEFLTIDEAKAWADAQPWGPVRWD